MATSLGACPCRAYQRVTMLKQISPRGTGSLDAAACPIAGLAHAHDLPGIGEGLFGPCGPSRRPGWPDQKVTSGSPTKSATKLTKKNPKNRKLRTRIT